MTGDYHYNRGRDSFVNKLFRLDKRYTKCPDENERTPNRKCVQCMYKLLIYENQFLAYKLVTISQLPDFTGSRWLDNEKPYKSVRSLFRNPINTVLQKISDRVIKGFYVRTTNKFFYKLTKIKKLIWLVFM